MPKYIFVVSTGRTATKALSEHLSEHVAQAVSFHEPSPSFARRAPALISRVHRRSERVYFGMPRRCRQAFHRKGAYVEFNHRLFSALPLIRRTFSNACIIHIVRDGRAVVRSWLNKGRYTRSDNFFTPADIPGSGVALEDWLTWSAVKKNAWNWALVNGVIDAQGPDYQIHFENIFDPQRNDLARVLNEIAPNVFDPEALHFADTAHSNAARQSHYPDFKQWPEARQREFWEAAGDQMRAFGYGADDVRDNA